MTYTPKTKKKGKWGGKYECPSGLIYLVGDNNDLCQSLAGEGGKMIDCQKREGDWSHKQVVCGSKAINYKLAKLDKYRSNWWFRGGKWGGEYKCPSGKIYQVADKGDFCRTLAGTGGKMLNCNRFRGPWTRRYVKCAHPYMLDKYTKNKKKGTWGGDYKCPSGKVYQVADNRDYCRSLAGSGGEMLNCQPIEGPWSYRQVICN